MGKKVQSSKFNVQSFDPELNSGLNFKSETLNISDLTAGMYFIRIQTENGTVTKKVVKR
jgi:hypothetical protein